MQGKIHISTALWWFDDFPNENEDPGAGARIDDFLNKNSYLHIGAEMRWFAQGKSTFSRRWQDVTLSPMKSLRYFRR